MIMTRTEYKYIDLGLPSGTLWAACNVGANAPEEYGGHYAGYDANNLGVTLPTKGQILELCTKCKSIWTRRNNTEGRLFTGLTGNSIFLPAAGIINNGLLRGAGFGGDYWSSEQYFGRSSTATAYHLYIGMVCVGLGRTCCHFMQSVRAVKNKE